MNSSKDEKYTNKTQPNANQGKYLNVNKLSRSCCQLKQPCQDHNRQNSLFLVITCKNIIKTVTKVTIVAGTTITE